MRNDSHKTPDAAKEIRYRLWWALVAVEYQLASITGRASSILVDHCSSPLPAPYDEDKFPTPAGQSMLSSDMQKTGRNPNSKSPSATGSTPHSERSSSGPNAKTQLSRSPSNPRGPTDLEWAKAVPPSASLYFLHFVQLTRISQRILNQLYTPPAIVESWSNAQKTMASLNEDLDVWFKGLPSTLDFKRKQRDRDYLEPRMSLGFFYYATAININRPCLCRLDRKIPNQSAKSMEFNRTSAQTCVESAQTMISLIPDEPNAIGLNRIGPWWNLLHYLVQAAVVLMLELSFRADHMPEEAENILEASKKVVRWLHQLAEQSLAARRAWGLCNQMLRAAAPKVGRQATDIPDYAPATKEGVPMQAQTHQQDGFNYQHMMPPDMPAFQNSTPNFANFAGYDQFFPFNDLNHNFDHNQSNFPDSTEMDFMSHEYHDHGGRGGVGSDPDMR